ncbi:fungal-specific transcription factor domain-containing protein [Cladorrhinum sp. PSN332]|nr:fungal-specific transcription factor domain-containing protein [Cladorrhinum sp. PSN332]
MSIPPTGNQRSILPMPASSSPAIPGPEILPSNRTLPPGHKRTRVLLSCGPCRLSKQKCDRLQPCTNCIKKSREGLCTYAPKPAKLKPDRSMAARLKRLEGLVREVMNTQQPPPLATDRIPQVQDQDQGTPAVPARTVLTAPRSGTDEADDEEPRAQVVVGKGGQGTYIGATHFMAMLDDIEDLKSYFDDDDDETPEDNSIAASMSTGIGPTPARPYDSPDGPQPSSSHSPASPEVFLFAGNTSTSKQGLIEMLPPREVVDRLIERYFSACSPSHPSPQFLSLLWIILALGTLLSKFTAPHELETDNPPLPPTERFRRYRAAALQALITGGLSSPSLTTLQAVLLYAESEFLVNRKTQMNCYLIISVCVRLMFRMGLHRDASKLPNITPFDGEMRRRLWHVACQFDLLVSFHLGLPSMVDRVESDTSLPKHLIDSDFSPESLYLPDPRPDSEYTQLTYPIWKSSICQVFGLVASRANSLRVPNYVEVMYLDRQLEARWAQVPDFMRQVRPPPDNSISDSPHMLNQRFGLVSLYQKSRRTCLEAAIALLDYQEFMHLATLPGGALRSSGWFITALAIHDFLLAAMVVYLVLLNEEISEQFGGDGYGKPALSSRNQLFDILEKSHRTWVVISQDDPASVKAAATLETMLRKLRSKNGDSMDGGKGKGVVDEENNSWQIVREPPVSVGSLSVSDELWDSDMNFDPADQIQVPLSRQGLMPSSTTFDAAWLDVNMGTDEMSWRTFDDAMSGQNSNIIPQDVEDWIEQGPLLPDVSSIACFGLQGPYI